MCVARPRANRRSPRPPRQRGGRSGSCTHASAPVPNCQAMKTSEYLCWRVRGCRSTAGGRDSVTVQSEAPSVAPSSWGVCMSMASECTHALRIGCAARVPVPPNRLVHSPLVTS